MVSYDDIMKVSGVQVDSVLVSTISIIPMKNGRYVLIRVDLKAYQSQLDECKNSLIGRVVLSSGEKPWKLVDLKAKLQSIWKLSTS